MRDFFKKYFQGDSVIWTVFFLLCMISIVELYSASSSLAFRASNHAAPMLRHAMFLALGAAIVAGVHMINYKSINKFAYVLLVISVLALIYALLRGVNANDAKRWIGVAGIQFQPSEFAKISLLVVVADLISKAKNAEELNKSFIKIVIVTLVICGLICLENLSTACILFGVVFLMMIIGRIPFKKLGMLLGGIAVAILLLIACMHIVPENHRPKAFNRYYTWENRIARFMKHNKADKDKYVITDENYQVMHGQIAIARGGVIGVFPGNSLERNYLPQAYADYIYAIVVEETGLLGGIFVMVLYLFLLFRAGQIAWRCNEPYPSLLVIGLTLMIVIQAMVSMGVTVHLGPVTGQPLPIISRGGTSILVTSVYFGIILSVTRYFKKGKQKTESPDTNTTANEPTE
jgi:Bacterial cell division membrane protein